MKRILTGNYAVAEAVKMARTEFIAAYPITPQTTIVERLAEIVERGELRAEFVRVESEHSALAAVYGASAGGLRAFTATSSHGLLYMYEMCWWVANSRLPIVMALITRTIGPPWNIHTDHTDLLTLRDSGWILAMSENAQEAFDLTLIGFKVAEQIDLPFAVGLDGFQVSHTAEVVDIPEQSEIDRFLPDRRRDRPFVIEPGNPITVGGLTTNECAMMLRHDMMRDMEKVGDLVRNSGYIRDYDLIEEYRLEDAEYVVVMMGAWCGDAKDAIDILRDEGVQIGMLRLRFVRPFPAKEIANIDCKKILVVERDSSIGKGGIIATEVRSVANSPVQSVMAGLGGVDVGVEDFVAMFRRFVEGDLGEWWM